MKILEKIKGSNLYHNYRRRFNYLRIRISHIFSDDETITKAKWSNFHSYELNLGNPKTLNEKIQWLKLHDYKPIYTIWADKYAFRQYIKEHFGEEYLIPLIFVTNHPRQINEKNISSFPCVIKGNHNSGDYVLLRTKDDIDSWRHLRRDCATWLKENFYYISQERQYKDIKRKIVVEKMLLNKEGKIPNDYKLHFANGKLIMVYCSIDREGSNYRQIFDHNWKLLNISWGGVKKNYRPIPKPTTFNKMVEIGKHFAKQVCYVRVDFYDVDGKLYCGEVTLYCEFLK